MLYVCTKSSKSRNLKNSKKVEILYIFFNRFTKQRKEKFLYTLFIFHHRARVISLGATICPKISKIPKISNFSQLHLIYPGKLILRSSLIYSPPKHVSRKSSTLYFAYNNTTTPVLSFFFFLSSFFFFHIQIYDRYSPTRFTISRTSVPANIFVTNAYVTQVWFFRINWQYICKFLRNERSFVIIREQR